jgi:hypothetical protein
MEAVSNLAESRPIATGIIGTIAGWSGALVAWLDIFHKVFLVLGGCFGTIAAFYTMMIVIRSYKDKQANK